MPLNRVRDWIRWRAAVVLTLVLVTLGWQGTSFGQSPDSAATIVNDSADTYVRADADVRRNDNYGCQHFMAVGTDRVGGADAMRSLVRFDLSGLGSGPIARARLELTVYGFDNGTLDSGYTVDLHRIVDSGRRTPWLEGLGFETGPGPRPRLPDGCVGTDPADGVAWVGLGDGGDPENRSAPDFSDRVIDSAVIGQGTTGNGDVVSWDVTETVSGWLDGTYPNYGLLLRDRTTDGTFRGVRFGTREGLEFDVDDVAPPVAGPRLVVEFAEVGPVCTSASLGPVRLAGREGQLNMTEPVAIDLPDGRYEIILESADGLHRRPDQSPQPQERWVLEGLDAAGAVVFTTTPSDDLADDALRNLTAVGRYEAVGAVAVRARHASVGPRWNSIEAVRAFFASENCGAANRCADIGDLKDLHRCDLSLLDLQGTSIRGADLTAADLSGASLYGADLSHSSLRDANLDGADFTGARLVAADLSNTGDGSIELSGADLTRANLSHSTWLLGTARGAILADAEVSNAQLGLDLVGADLRRVVGRDSGWAGSDLTRADIGNARLFSASFTASGFPDAGVGRLLPSRLANARLVDAVLSASDMRGVDLRSADLAGAVLRGTRLGAADLRRADLTGADLTGADLGGALLDKADLTGVIWEDTICPDGSSSSANGGTCAGNLDPSQRRRLRIGPASSTVRPAPRWEPQDLSEVVEELRPGIPFTVSGRRVAIDGTVWVEVDTVGGAGWVDGRDLRPWADPAPAAHAPCDPAAMFDVIDRTIYRGGGLTLDRVVINECADGAARVVAIPEEAPLAAESEQVFLVDEGGSWKVLTFGTGIDCRDVSVVELDLLDACDRLGLRPPETTAEVFFYDERRVGTGVRPFVVPVERTVSAQDPEFEALRWLFVGPIRNEPDLDLTFFTSEATGFTEFSIRDRVARLRLTGGCDNRGSEVMSIAEEILATLTRFPSIDHVKIFDPRGNTADPGGRTTSLPGCLTQPDSPGPFRVVGVAADDVLNVRVEPSGGAAIVGALAPGAEVVSIGHATADVPTSGWWDVLLPDGTVGWVNRRFVGLTDGPDFDRLACGDPTIAPSSTARSPEALGNADHVQALQWASSATCDRLIILLGTGATGDPWGDRPADRVPTGVTVTTAGSVVSVSLPTPVAAVRPTATEATGASGRLAVTAREEAGPQGPFVIRAHYERNVFAAITFLDSPARIVVDTIGAPTGTGLALEAVPGVGVVLEHPVQIDLNGPGVGLPVTVSGYARPFEAQGLTELRTAAGAPGAGEPVVADFDGYGPETVSRYNYRTTDWVDTWGRFSFTIDGFDPGRYELFVGEIDIGAGSPVGVFEQFTAPR